MIGERIKGVVRAHAEAAAGDRPVIIDTSRAGVGEETGTIFSTEQSGGGVCKVRQRARLIKAVVHSDHRPAVGERPNITVVPKRRTLGAGDQALVDN